jgi:hypothetical protein
MVRDRRAELAVTGVGERGAVTERELPGFAAANADIVTA